MDERPGTPFSLEVHPQLPPALGRLHELANNLWFSWDRQTRSLFARLDPQLWDALGHNPVATLKGMDQRRADEAARDPVFLHDLERALAAFDAYRAKSPEREAIGFGPDDLVAYFCAEFGFHESLPIYSGGLGILAGDHCKTASDLAIPFVAVGLLYRQGYFHQTIDGEGVQHAHYYDSDFGDLPISPVRKPDGSMLEVRVEFGEHDVFCKIWLVRVGRINLYLLDTDHEKNRPEDRATAHRLYGGDRNTRIQQEIVLGMGGFRALEALGIKPTVWHMNEGHAAFLVLERMRALVRQGMDRDAALEAVAANTIFTTHTAVAAGHDHFVPEKMDRYFHRYCAELGMPKEQLLALGRTPSSHDFNMTALAARGSRFMNGVSRIHGDVSALILAELWPEVPEQENPISYVTNGVHVPSFLAPEMAEAFERLMGTGWNHRLGQQGVLEAIASMPDHQFWSIRQHLKARMLHLVGERVRVQHFRNHGSEAHLDRMLKFADPANPNVLTIGFARRFATYKRATLMFDNLEWLHEITSDPKRPVLFLFAGKAHPADEPGKEFMRRITQVASMPQFEGRILLVEGYDLRLARRLVSGVDVWLNNPVFPLEASGTSGMKAGFNGVINLSVLDGWWGEGYTGDNGWAIKPASEQLSDERRNQEESRSLYELMQDKVIPLYYDREAHGFSPHWVKMAKRSIMTLMPQYNSERMVNEYLTRFYRPAAERGHRFSRDGHGLARDVAQWKKRVASAWPRVQVRTVSLPAKHLSFSETGHFVVGVKTDGINAEDIAVELLLSPAVRELATPGRSAAHLFKHTGERGEGGEYRYTLDLAPELCGKLEYRIRAYPHHPALSHRFELGLMKWV